MIWALLLLWGCVPKAPALGLEGARTSPALSEGRIEGMRQLYVPPEAFAQALRPSAANAETADTTAVWDLPLENIASARAVVLVNGVELGQIGPYTTAVIHGVAPGVYELGFRVPNGYTRPVRAGALPGPLSMQEPLRY